ncbi:MAG: hypothetical protein EON60_03425 [Alphaproteobacteria bacterium]|nr:MAG: hypothetical protein EON60_03425 [Alphaproteobacteria bacterium]
MKYDVFYLAATSELCPAGSAVIVDDEAGFRFVSGIRDLVWKAGMDGQLLYFAEKRLYAVYGNLPHHPGRASFWWLFEDCRNPENGFLAKKSWFGKAMKIANMGSAEFAAAHMQQYLDRIIAVQPDYLSQPLECVLPKLVDMFREEMKDYMHAFQSLFPNTGIYPAQGGEPERMIFASFSVMFVDETELVIDQRGYSAAQNVECEIMARNAEGMIDPRVISLTECDAEMLSRIQ